MMGYLGVKKSSIMKMIQALTLLLNVSSSVTLQQQQKSVSYAQQCWIYLIKNTVETVIM